MTVTRAYRGVTGERIDIFTGQGDGDCGYPFVIGQAYLVYANHSPRAKVLATSICTTTKAVGDADDDLRYLNSLDSLEPGARVSGLVTHTEDDPTRENGRSTVPGVGFTVALTGDVGTLETLTDEQGRFHFDRVPVGRYQARVHARPLFAPVIDPFDVQLPDPRACAEIGFGVRYDGRIDGRLVGPGGEPIAGVTMYLRWAEPADDESTFGGHSETDTNGRFSLGPLSPGRYVLGIGLERLTTTDIPYPTTWYPDAANRDEAAVIDVGPGDHVALERFTVPSRLRQVTVRGRVSWPPSVRLGYVRVYVADADTNAQIRQEKAVNADGSFEFTLNEGRRYVIEASGTLPGTRFELRTQSGVFEPSASTPEVILLLTP
jgi:hypothetical protein